MATLEFVRDRQPPGRGDALSVGEGIVYDGLYIVSTDVPSKVAAGDTVQISGRIEVDKPSITPSRPVRVVISSGWLNEPIVNDVGVMGPGDTAAFDVTVTVPNREGEQFTFVIETEVDPLGFGGWNTTDNQTARMAVVTREEARTEAALGYLPWAAGGAAAGALYSRQTAGYVDRRTAAIGAGGGVVARAAFGGFSIPSFPTKNTLALAALLGAGALAVNQVSNVGSLPTPDTSVVTDRLPGSGSGSRS